MLREGLAGAVHRDAAGLAVSLRWWGQASGGWSTGDGGRGGCRAERKENKCSMRLNGPARAVAASELVESVICRSPRFLKSSSPCVALPAHTLRYCICPTHKTSYPAHTSLIVSLVCLHCWRVRRVKSYRASRLRSSRRGKSLLLFNTPSNFIPWSVKMPYGTSFLQDIAAHVSSRHSVSYRSPHTT